MRLLVALSCLVLLVAALPQNAVTIGKQRSTFAGAPWGLSRRQNSDQPETCPAAILLYARGSDEAAPFGGRTGQSLLEHVKQFNGNGTVRVIGLEGKYRAKLMDALRLRGTQRAAISSGVDTFKKQMDECPKAAILAAGYSQGSSLIISILEDLPEKLRSRVLGTALFGTPGLQAPRAKRISGLGGEACLYCQDNDWVCKQGLSKGISFNWEGHGDYYKQATTFAARFFTGRIMHPSSTSKCEGQPTDSRL